MMNVIDEMANDALQDEYFLNLFNRAEKYIGIAF